MFAQIRLQPHFTTCVTTLNAINNKPVKDLFKHVD